jgi:hypothetical protein
VCTEIKAARLLGILLVIASARPVGAQQPMLEVSVPDVAVTVGDRVPVRVQARGGDDWMWGDLTVTVAGGDRWAVVDGPHEMAGARPPAWTVALAPLAVGKLELPRMSVSVRPPDGEPRIVAVEDQAVVEVASVLPPEEEVPPAPLRDPLGVHGLPWEWLVPILIVLIPALALQYWWLKRRGERVDGDSYEDLPPLEQFTRLAADLDAGVGTIPSEAVCDGLAGGFRRYLERRTGEPAQEMTSFELRALARKREWPESVQRCIHRVMEVVDGIRFGRSRVPDAELRQTLTTALDGARELERSLVPEDDATSMEAAS